jgi:AraC-like DNA-binding protein
MQKRNASLEAELGKLPRASGALVRLAARRLLESGVVDPEPLLKDAGLNLAVLTRPDLHISSRSQMLFLELAAEAIGDDLLGFHIARDDDVRELGPLYYVMASSEKLIDALEREARYAWTVDEGVRTICRRAPELTVEVKCPATEDCLRRHFMEFWMTCTLRKCRQFTGRELVPNYVGFVHHRESGRRQMETYFRCDLSFDAASDEIRFDQGAADLPFVNADPSLNQILIDYLEQATARRQFNPDSLQIRVERAISTRLPHGTVSMKNVGRDLGMSARTLARRLSEERLSFSAIVNELGRSLALRHLEDHKLSISQVAWLLGYTEPSSFVRAVRRWTGKSPSEVRREGRQVRSTSASFER